MTLPQALNNYYSSQRTMASLLCFISTVLVLQAWIAVRQKKEELRSFGIVVLCIAGLFMLPANLYYLFYVGRQYLGYAVLLKRDPNAFRLVEIQHLHHMFPTFLINISLFASVGATGILITLIGFIKARKSWKGLGPGIILCALILLSVEIWSRNHAIIYQRSLVIEGS